MNASQFNDMSLDGTRTSGQDVRNQNVTAAMAIANVVKSSLGPVGLGKFVCSGPICAFVKAKVSGYTRLKGQTHILFAVVVVDTLHFSIGYVKDIVVKQNLAKI